MIWQVLITLVVLSATVYSESPLTPSKIEECQKTCGVPLDIRTNPDDTKCKKWNNCDYDDRKCAAFGNNEELFTYTDNVCETSDKKYEQLSTVEKKECITDCGVPNNIIADAEANCAKWKVCNRDKRNCAADNKGFSNIDYMCGVIPPPTMLPDYVSWYKAKCGIPSQIIRNPTEKVCEHWNVSC
ncbi:DUF19 domain-containing protein [Caenorhabditis elegans]|uniref:DUF19 domain-containing protein n=1 Tax=Caenorhabditis elegans TaxID=6239 RepID=Q5FC39_CAEEL|nr:DUF19 domain-containing protein [Caenorhabditis elegans]CAI46570.1 DUF19 domain-containing protein [Caenorhabditis elegans]|eukprot:NP_001256554.1 Uncharacterized protein CELE_D1086.11 [Caenorhabditis elegans]